jgi:hypothetical protein
MAERAITRRGGIGAILASSEPLIGTSSFRRPQLRRAGQPKYPGGLFPVFSLMNISIV